MRIIGHPAIKLINKIERGVYTNPIRTFVLLMRGALPATLEQCGCCRGPRRLVGGPCSRTNHMLNLYIYIYIYIILIEFVPHLFWLKAFSTSRHPQSTLSLAPAALPK